MQQAKNQPWEGKLPRVDFHLMDMDALLRYKKRFQLNVPATASRTDLAIACARHFATLGLVDEKDTIVYFSYSLKNQGNQLKLPPPMPNTSPFEDAPEPEEEMQE